MKGGHRGSQAAGLPGRAGQAPGGSPGQWPCQAVVGRAGVRSCRWKGSKLPHSRTLSEWQMAGAGARRQGEGSQRGRAHEEGARGLSPRADRPSCVPRGGRGRL